MTNNDITFLTLDALPDAKSSLEPWLKAAATLFAEDGTPIPRGAIRVVTTKVDQPRARAAVGRILNSKGYALSTVKTEATDDGRVASFYAVGGVKREVQRRTKAQLAASVTGK